MNVDEIKTASQLLDDRADRLETTGADTEGGLALTAHWRDGGQKLFYTLDEVRDHIAEH